QHRQDLVDEIGNPQIDAAVLDEDDEHALRRRLRPHPVERATGSVARGERPSSFSAAAARRNSSEFPVHFHKTVFHGTPPRLIASRYSSVPLKDRFGRSPDQPVVDQGHFFTTSSITR